MAKRTETVMEERVRTIAVVCDMCGAEAARVWDLPFPASADEHSNTQDVRVEASVSTSYPDTGWGKSYKVDLCARCFVDTVVPLLEGAGATVEVTEIDW